MLIVFIVFLQRNFKGTSKNVIALNKAGQSPPSNTIAVVL